ncbi:unnamed protein product [Amoebophrya sp. A25]|nr:unnamed protein product [Amoebophrya sp. A25]|eukprot:GSA25T00009712001.1
MVHAEWACGGAAGAGTPSSASSTVSRGLARELTLVDYERYRQKFSLSRRARNLLLLVQVVWPAIEAYVRGKCEWWRSELMLAASTTDDTSSRDGAGGNHDRVAQNSGAAFGPPSLLKAWLRIVRVVKKLYASFRDSRTLPAQSRGTHAEQMELKRANPAEGNENLSEQNDDPAQHAEALQTEPSKAAVPEDHLLDAVKDFTKHLSVRIFEVYHVTTRVLQLSLRVRYLLNLGGDWTILLWLLHLQIARRKPGEGNIANSKGDGDSSNGNDSVPVDSDKKDHGTSRIPSSTSTPPSSFSSLLSQSFSAVPQAMFWVSIYGLQLAHWYQSRQQEFAEEQAGELRGGGRGGGAGGVGGSSGLTGNEKVSQEELPLAPQPPRKHKIPLYQSTTLCNLCGEPRKNPAQSVGGYVFCFACLANHVRDKGCCPITGWKMEVRDVRKVLPLE